jgi:ABC-type thiamin/hydroxymethylpyrimidine transport system permease subunit
MSALHQRILGSVISAAVTAAIAYLAPEYQQAALGLFAAVMTALHIPRPGDASPAEVSRVASEAVSEALSDVEVH